MNEVTKDILMHYGVKRRSGRYPWGSGDNPYQHSGDFLSRVEELRKQNFTYTDENGKKWTGDVAIAKSMGLSSSDFRNGLAIAGDERRRLLVDRAESLRNRGLTLKQIADEMGYANDSSVRSLLDEKAKARMNASKEVYELLKERIDSTGKMLDVGAGTEISLGVSSEKLNQAILMLEMDGYVLLGRGVSQVTNRNQQTNLKLICPPGTEPKDVYNNDNIGYLDDVVSYDNGKTFKKAFEYPASFDSKRLMVRYGDEGGSEKDGLIEIRPGVEDISLGDSHYAQVRILVDGTHYMKGMAVYSDKLPDGVDIVFNTNKNSDVPIMGDKKSSILKPIKDDPDNPFGSYIKEHGGQRYYIGEDGKEHLSVINKRAEEGDWGEWSKELSSQFLAKQSKQLISKQLGLAVADKQAEFDEIMSLTNPTVRKMYLKEFSDDCDGAAVHLKAAALPRQKYQVIMPLTTLKDNEVYAPNFNDGEIVALVRYPHAGRFEIPMLTVNNRNKEGQALLTKTPADSIGISKKTADQLSGADFDGDTVLVIPAADKVGIKAKPPLRQLENFDPHVEYAETPGMKLMTKRNTQTEMGKISNLISDMTIMGATDAELARAVKHSMVVIDAEKHRLDYTRSFKENGIAALKEKYQGGARSGAATILTKAKSEERILKRVGSPKIDPETGEVSFKSVVETYLDSKGKEQTRTIKSTKMAETKDAYTLVRDPDNDVERAYADYANTMKQMANDARKAMVNTPRLKRDPTAAITYKEQVESLEDKLRVAQANAPRERQARIIADGVLKAKTTDNPTMTGEEKRKAYTQALNNARIQTGSSRRDTAIKLTDKEWEAIQAGAISDTRLGIILNHTDKDSVRQRAMPRTSIGLSDAKQAQLRAMKASGYTTAEIADRLNISTSTVSDYLRGKK